MGSLPANGIATQGAKTTSSSAASCAILSLFRERPKSRSPVESPPLLKRPLHLVEPSRLGVRTPDGPLSCFLNHVENEKKGKENRSILKSESPRRIRSKSDPNRKVNFRQKVLVFHFDREEGRHVGSESLILNSEPEVKKNFIQLAQLQNTFSISLLPSNASIAPGSSFSRSVTGREVNQTNAGSTPRRNAKATPLPKRRPLLAQKNIEDTSVLVPHDIDFQYAVDDSHNPVLRFSLPLGLGTSASDVIVKANKTGNRVRVLGSTSKTPTNRGREIGERFGLPVRVDSYRISARIDSCGTLFVEAPILPGEMKPAIIQGR